MAINRDDDRKTDHRLSGGDGHNEENYHLSFRGAQKARERDERKVDGVQHKLDGHQNDNQIPAHEHAEDADGKYESAKNQVVVERWHRQLMFPLCQNDGADNRNQ